MKLHAAVFLALGLLSASSCGLKALNADQKTAVKTWAESFEDLSTGMESAQDLARASSGGNEFFDEARQIAYRVAARANEKAQRRREQIDATLKGRTRECSPVYKSGDTGAHISIGGTQCPARFELKTSQKVGKDSTTTEGRVSFELRDETLRNSVDIVRGEFSTESIHKNATAESNTEHSVSGSTFSRTGGEAKVTFKEKTITSGSANESSLVTLYLKLAGFDAEVRAEIRSDGTHIQRIYTLNGQPITEEEALDYGIGAIVHFRLTR